MLLAVGTYAALLFPPAVLSAPLAVGVVFFLQGLPLLCWNVVVVTAVQTVVPNQILGRVSSVFRLTGRGLAPVGLFLGGLIGSWWGLRSVFAVAGAGLTFAFLANYGGLSSAARQMHDATAAPPESHPPSAPGEPE